MNTAFWPQHHLGFMGMPRRVHTYLAEMGWSDLNLLSTAGAYLIAISIVVMLVNIAVSLRSGEIAGPNPWNADTLEWATTSPPRNFNFADLPTVRSPHPLWDPEREQLPVVRGLRDDQREVLVTTGLDAEPDARLILPGPTIVPFLAALAVSVAFIGVMFEQYFVPIGGFLFFLAVVLWNWPRHVPRLEGPDGPEHVLARRERELEHDVTPEVHHVHRDPEGRPE
jgi:cytochrome c oxidase subunit I+III